MRPAVSLKNLKKDYFLKSETVHALRGVTFDVPQGDYVAIMGPSGCGKSTLLNILGLLDAPSRGSYRFEDREMGELGDTELTQLRGSSIGFVFQSFNLIDDLNVSENVEVGLLYRGLGSAERRRLVGDALEKVGIEHRARHYPSQLSGGQQQRAAIARALVGKPKLLLADEPTGNLDAASGAEVFALMRQMNRESGVAFVMITHDDRLARAADRVLVIEHGLVFETDGSLRPARPDR